MKYLKSMAAPYAHLGVRFIPLGGLTAKNMAGYLADPIVPAIGGSWLATRQAINAEDWETITGNAAEARKIVDDLRAGKS